MNGILRRLTAASAALALVPLSAALTGWSSAGGNHPPAAARWVNAWQGSPVGGGTIPGASCPADKGLNNQTVRNIVFLSAGGDRVRVRLTNAFGTKPLSVGAASVALAGAGAATVVGSDRALRFGGRGSILIAAGGEALSDPVRLRVRALQKLDVSVYLPTATGPATQHWD